MVVEGDVLISPVSTQVLPIVVTVAALKPRRVVLLTTPKVYLYAKFLKRALIVFKVEVEERIVDPYSFSSIKEKVEKEVNPFVLLNCGTKFTAISLFRIFGEENCFYYLPTGKIVNFNGKELLTVPDDLLDVELHSKIYGFEIVEERLDYEKIRRREKLTVYIANNPLLIPVLTKLFHRGFVERIPFQEFIKLAQKKEVISYRGGKFFAVERDYIGGKWLEEFVFLKLLELNFYDVRIGVKVRWYGEDVVNEIDVMATKRNRLYLFSCKTGKNAKEISKHLYELEELTERIGGDFGKSYLVITENLISKGFPSRKDFPNAPKVKYKGNEFLWHNYYKTPEGKRYRELVAQHLSFQNLKKRAKLLKIELITPRKLGSLQ